MDRKMLHFYLLIDQNLEYCFNIKLSAKLTIGEYFSVKRILSDGSGQGSVSEISWLKSDESKIVEIGPRLNFASPFHSNVSQIFRACHISKIVRIERSLRYAVEDGQIPTFDKMTHMIYPEPLKSFDIGILPEATYEVDLKSKGPDGLAEIPGISMDERDRNLYYDYFVLKLGRNPTIVEIMDLNNANSEHSRHGFFKGKQVIDGVEMKKTLFELVTDTLTANPKGSLIAFSDNSSVIKGYTVPTIIPENPGKASKFISVNSNYNPLLTAETHNFPTGIAPFPGAETGTGGRIRDVQGTGRGGFVIAGTAGYCVGNLNIPGYNLPWEIDYERPDNLATPLKIVIGASNGASDYGNKFGEPVIQGFTRSYDMRFANGERWGFLKPIMFTGGIGQIDDRLLTKATPEKGMLIVQVGGPAYRVGFGGGAASSMLQGENEAKLDFNAVQRGDAEMEQKMNRVVRACNEMGDKTLVEVIHDQGAGGPANVLKELVEKSGGRMDIRLVKVGDPTMSVLEIYVAEYQERMGFLIRPENIGKFKAICEREKVNCEVLGEATNDMRFVVYDSWDGSIPVDIHLPTLLGSIPQKTFVDERKVPEFKALDLPEDLTVIDALYHVLRLVSVGSKRFLTNKVDRAVTGLIAQQQCCGPLQLTVADVAVVAQSHFGVTGIATAIGETSSIMTINPRAGARMAVAEAMTNLVWAGIEDPDQIKCSANWMWAPKLPGEGAALYDAAEAMRDMMITVKIAVDGGKDSLSMATVVETAMGKEVVKSPRELVISVYAAVPDIRKVITPDIKNAEKEKGSAIIFIDLAGGKTRLGGSALAQVFGQTGDETPDVEFGGLKIRYAFDVIQELISKGLILAGHDVSGGGLITSLLEMAFAGNCGLRINYNRYKDEERSVIKRLFAEEVGLLIECDWIHVKEVCRVLGSHNIFGFRVLGKTTKEKRISVVIDGKNELDVDMRILRSWWEETSHQLERLQVNPKCTDQEKEENFERKGPKYIVPFELKTPDLSLLTCTDKPKVAILREEGSNGDREMTSAFYLAGFEVWDVTMTDFLSGKIKLDMFRGLVAVGGFSYADYPSSAKGWASVIRENEMLWVQFQEFYHDPSKFTFGICNGCQLFGLLGFVPGLGINPKNQPRFIRNISGRFESRWTSVRVQNSNAIMLKDMEGLVFGIHVDHGEGQLYFPDPRILAEVKSGGMTPMVYVDDDGEATEKYPFNPNGSVEGLAGLCSEDGRHLALMPHPERVFKSWQAHYLPEEMKEMEYTPWMQMFMNAYEWCMDHK